jgi:hypothetical protein
MIPKTGFRNPADVFIYDEYPGLEDGGNKRRWSFEKFDLSGGRNGF